LSTLATVLKPVQVLGGQNRTKKGDKRMSISRHSGGGEQVATAAFSAVLMVLLVSLLVSGWLIIQALNLILNAFAHHPKHPALWIPLLSTLGAWTATGIIFSTASFSLTSAHPLVQGLVIVLGVLDVLAPVSLLVIARVLEIMHSDLLMLDRGKTTLVDSVLRQPWWNGPDQGEQLYGSSDS
jgi:hypothetical protein